MDYLSIQDISNKWNISKRRIQVLCREGRINGAKMIGNMWVVPKDAERPTDARTKNPLIENKRYSVVRSDLKKLLKDMYKRSECIGILEKDRKAYVLSILAGKLCLVYIENIKDSSRIYKQIYNDISEKSMDYAIDDTMVGMASNFISKHENDAEIDSIVSWAYQYSNKLVVCSDYSQTQFFTEKYMINYLVRNIKELVNADKVLDPCSGGGNFLVECLELLCEFFNEGDVQKYIIDQTQKLYGYDIDNVIARIAVVNIRIKAISIMKKKGVGVSFDIWSKIIPHIFCAAGRDMVVGSLAKDNRLIQNVLTGELIEHNEALGNANVIITNPPFATVKGMASEQKEFLKNNYPLSNCDTCVAFMEAIGELLSSNGVCGIVSQNAWMYLKSFRSARDLYVKKYKFRNIANLGSGAFVDLSGEKSNVSLIIFENKKGMNTSSIKIQNYAMDSLVDKIEKLEKEQDVFEISQEKINGENGFILSEYNIVDLSETLKKQYSSVAVPMQGTSTGNSKELVGYFWEHFGDQEWIPVSNGGGYCRWEGLNNSVVKWGSEGEYIKQQKGSALRNVKYFNETQLVFSDTGTSGLNVRLLLNNQIFIASGPGIRILSGNKYAHMAFLNSRLAANFVRTISPKLTIAAGYIGRIPIKDSIFESTLLERKARLCVELKCKQLKTRPNNLEYVGSTQIGTEFDINQQAWELLRSDLLNELLKLELESQCDELILTEYGLNDNEKIALTETVGECAFDIKAIHDVDVSKLDKYFAKILDEACLLKRSRASKASLGCDGVLEFAAKDLYINPSSLVEQICQKPELMTSTLAKYKDLILHNYILHILGYSVSTGVRKEEVTTLSVIDEVDALYGKQMDILKWMERKFNSVHSGIFKGKPFIHFKDGEIRYNGK